MIPYFLLLIIPALFASWSVRVRRKKGGWTLSVVRTSHSLALPVFFFWLLLLLMLRHETVGRDLNNYKYIFQQYTTGGLRYVFNSWQEVLFRLYNWIIYQVTDNYQLYLAVTALVTVIPVAHVYLQDRAHGYMKIAVFVNMSIFIMLFSGLRQAIAMAVGMLAYCCVRKRKLTKFLLLAVAATLTHHSGFMVFFMYPLYWMKLKKKHLLIVIPIIVLIFVFKHQIFDFSIKLLSNVMYKYETSAESTGAYGMLLLFILFSVFFHVVTDRQKCDEETLGLFNYLLMTVALQCFAPVHTLAMRMNYYYILFIPIALGKCLSGPKTNMRQVAKTAEVVISLFFTGLFIVNTYQSYLTGISTLDTVPYIPFWKGP